VAFVFPARLGVIALAVGAACSDPSYGMKAPGDSGDALRVDAGATASKDATLDASVQHDASPPSDADFPLGEYALLARFYGISLPAGTGYFGEEAIAKVNVQRVNGELQMSWTYCAYRGLLVVPLVLNNVSYAVLHPESFPQRTYRIELDGSSFQAFGDTLLIGYEDLANCPEGSTQLHPERAWLSNGQCTCPSSTVLPPTLPSDCRVTDPDRDGKPGFTVQFTGGTENFSYTRIKDGSQILHGTIAANGHHTAQYSANSDTYQLSCAREPCTRASAQVCANDNNVVRFLPLPARAGEYTCQDVVNAVDNSAQIGLGMLSPSGC
jgi:hypothetical protein